ncbi:peptidoglycan-binding protein [Streptomyces sp. WZ.A104]|uniref:helix-turn-helix domain-containing protein n=1 Tax=Streptomyces sp. WZ.A104 TaxID=2023771 RepID=UPI000BBB9724|nr:helix-turn-helix domain-containing protein [Streptomyces sp. WZ.A104]PCG82321.1 peptidoglycan-binding protein [Streptomyces sp. WZ.A104]
MPRRRELPESLNEQAAELVAELRRARSRSGLTLEALARKTAYSKSSWERYLNGRTIPSADAVEALCSVAGCDPVRLLALRDVADAAARQSRGQRAVAPTEKTEEAGNAEGAASGVVLGEPAEPASAVDAPKAGRRGAPPEAEGDPPAPGQPGRPKWLWPAAVFLGAGMAVTGGLLFAAPWQGEGASPRSPLTSAHDGPYVWGRETAYPCRIQQHDGLTYAGHSATHETVLAQNTTSWDVVEAQCLLRAAGLDPGAVDGVYGPNTERAVKRLQAAAGIEDDGLVGPDTWKVLRG